jgi:hypothetical protein
MLPRDDVTGVQFFFATVLQREQRGAEHKNVNHSLDEGG